MERRRIRFGTFLAPFHSVRENPTLAFDRDLALVDHLDRLGFDEVWVGEHHSGGMEIVASPEIFIAAAAERTRRIMLGTGVVTLPYHNPFLVAERINQLDHQTKGRTMFGVGAGRVALRRGHVGDRCRADPRHDDRSARRHRSAARRRDGEPQDGLVRAPRGPASARPLHPPQGRARGSLRGIAVRPARRRQVRHEPAVDRRHHTGRVRGPAGDLEDLCRRGKGARPGRGPRKLAAGRTGAYRRNPRAGARQCALRDPGMAALFRLCRPPAARRHRRGPRRFRHRCADRVEDRDDRDARRPDRTD